MKRQTPLALAGLIVFVMVAAYLPTTTPAQLSSAPHVDAWSAELPSFAVASPGSVDLGPLPEQTLSVGVALPPVNPVGLDELIDSLSTPGSPDYGHFVSPALFREDFSPPASELSAVESYYAGYGLALQPSADRMILQLSGPSTEVGAAFHTGFDRFRLSSGDLVFGPTSPVVVPSGLGISGVTGFSDVLTLTPAGGAPTDAQVASIAPPQGPSTPAACSPVSGDTPAELEGQYGETSLISAGDNGKGITVGIVDAYDSSEKQTTLKSQLDSFASGCGLGTPTINFLYPTRTTANLNSTPSTGWGGETILDIETVDSMAPGATIDLTFAADSSLDVYEAVDYLVANNLTQTISESWGEPDTGTDYEPPQNPCLAYYSCNASWDGSYAFLHPIYAEAVAEGITPFAAAGDCGAYDGTGILTTDYPGSDPYVTDVGGTVLNTSGTTYGGESGWSGTGYECTANTGGGGGGYAPFPRPWWQSGEGLSTTNSLRGAPDVAASSADGTSEATPIWAGLTAVADQMHGGTGLGLLGPSIYSILRSPSEYASDFHDIVVGNNGYPAGRGWDPVTGIGSPDAANLLPNLWRTQVPSGQAMTVTLTASPGNTAAETFTATVSGGVAPYHYDFVPGLYLGQWAGTNHTLHYTYPGSGAYFATVEVWDSTGNWSESTPVLVEIGGTSLTGTLTPSTTSTTVGSPVAFTTSASGGTTPYAFDYLWGDGSYGYNGTASESHAYEAPGTYCPAVEVTDAASPVDGLVAYSTCITVTAGAGAPLSASITPSVSTGNVPLQVNFTSVVSGGSGSYAYVWSYGDGAPLSGAADPSHLYNRTGTFAVNLTVTDTASHLAHAYTNITVVTAPLSAQISASPLTGAPPLAVSFTSSVHGGNPGYSYAWAFGDGGNSNAADPSHTYSSAGTYTASLVVTDMKGATATSNSLTITVSSFPTLMATAAANTTAGTSPLLVAFNGTATGGEPGYRFSWSFGDGSTASAARNPTHEYNASGTYAVVLTVTDQQTLTAVSDLSIRVVPPLSVSASDSVGSGTSPLTVAFNGTASGGLAPYAWSWDFGDGSPASAARNPTHAYNATGTFSAKLTLTDALGDHRTSSLEIVVGAPTPLSANDGGPREVTVSTSVPFWATAAGGTAPYTYAWNFGDGTTAAATSLNTTSHTYPQTGTFTVTVSVGDAAGDTPAEHDFVLYVTSGTPLGVTLDAPSSATLGVAASFSATATGGAGGYRFIWTFGDGTVEDQNATGAGGSIATTHTFQKTGTFDVYVTVVDAAGAQESSAAAPVTVSNATSSGSSGSNPLLANGSLSDAGWLLVLALVAVVAAAIVLARRRGRAAPPPSEGAPPLTEYPSSPPPVGGEYPPVDPSSTAPSPTWAPPPAAPP